MVTPDQDPLFFLPGEAAVAPEAPEDRFERAIDPAELQRARAIARLAFRPRSAAYAELGGGIEQDEFEANDLVYGKLIDNFEPWKTEILQVFDQFNLPTLLYPGTLESMTKEHKRVLAHHFTHYVDVLENRSRVLKTPGSAASEDFAAYGFEGDDAKASTYGEELKKLHDILVATPVYGELHDISIRDKRTRRQREAYLKFYAGRHGKPALVLEKESGKYRFMPVDDQAHAHAS